MEDFQLFKNITIASRSGNYDVVFYESFYKHLSENFKEGDFVIIDQTIHELHPKIAEKFGRRIYIATALEITKSYSGIIPVLDAVIYSDFRKNNRLIAIGGGIIQDITSFIASILFRGVDYVFYPTNVLSQCDSCIGSKLSINFNQYKNLLGGFYPPKLIVIDTNFLTTLKSKDIASGLGEILHYCLVSSVYDFKFFMKQAPIVKQNTNNITPLLRRSLEIKKNMIEIDEFDLGPRNVFNYGHSFGHALESALDYLIPHGIAVAYGIDLANQVSVKKGLLTIEERNALRQACEIVFSEMALPPVDLYKYKAALLRDKKNVGNEIGLILSRGIGDMFFKTCPYVELEETISLFFNNKSYLTSL